ncbi:hypothetical protein HUJ04_006359 [Dendroctonus ponderosae]|nr:hypothetical protein HUJ04_006359 [Dendroctonus ponderosae]
MKSNSRMENGDITVRETHCNNLTTWWSSRTKNEKKCSYCVFGFMLSATLGLVVYFALFADKNIICKSSECQAASTQLLGFIDNSQNACDNFYQFACGSSRETNTSAGYQNIMEDDINIQIRQMLDSESNNSNIPSIDLAKQFYKVCFNNGETRNGMKHLTSVLHLIGGWPVLEGYDWKAERFTSWAVAVRTLRNYGVNFNMFFDINVDVDREHPERYILSIHPNLKHRFFNGNNSEEFILNYMSDIAAQFYPQKRIQRQELIDVLNFIFSLEKISEKSRRLTANKPNNLFYTISDLQSEYPTIPWIEYLEGVLRAVPLRPDDLINVADPLYLKHLHSLLNSTNPRIIANFMGWQVIQSLINFLPPTVQDKSYTYLEKINGDFYRKPRWKICVEAIRERMSAVINMGYIKLYFDNDTKYRVMDLIRAVKNTFRKRLLMAEWLDKVTKRKVMKILMSSVVKLYSDSDLVNLAQESSFYNEINIGQDELLKGVLHLNLVYWDLHYARLIAPVQDEWVRSQTFLSGSKVSYSATENILKFPLGIFRGIYFDSSRPDYMNYALLGNVLGHQISHIFVDGQLANMQASKTAQQKILNWWSAESLQAYLDIMQCISNQFSRFQAQTIGTPHVIHTIGPLQNLDEFARDFKCSIGSYMNPREKCRI